ncbi:MAG: portal protein, partial [Bacteroidetes bacterium]|nr:portal protein [Bacteroidota bacterium]
KIYIAEFYYREKVKTKLVTMSDDFGNTMTYKNSDILDVMDEMIDSGFEVDEEKEIEAYQVTKYIASGEKILDESIIAGEHLPIIPMYGEYAYVEGEPHYEGIVRPAKDPQRLRNFGMSYLGDIMSKSPRPKPVYFPEQINGFEDMYSGETDYPYVNMNRKAPDGTDLPIGPVAITPDQPIPQALAATIELTRQAVEDVASAGLPAEMSDPGVQIAHKTVAAFQKRL